MFTSASRAIADLRPQLLKASHCFVTQPTTKLKIMFFYCTLLSPNKESMHPNSAC